MLEKSILFKYVTVVFVFVLFVLVFATTTVAAEIPPEDLNESKQPTLPDLTHQYLALHAAESHGNSSDQTVWIAQGAYDEDHQIPPTFGWHSWDPDTGRYWWSPTGDGPALERANMLFGEAVDLYASDSEAAWKLLGQSLHLLQDESTPAHAHADPHACIAGIGDCDAYETWLGENNLVNTWTWIDAHPPGIQWDMHFTELPNWFDLPPEMQTQLEDANDAYGGRTSGQELWEAGPIGIDPVLFRLMYLMAESADNYNSGGTRVFPGEIYNGNLGDPSYLAEMRDDLFPYAVTYSTGWIDYFEDQTGISDVFVFLPAVLK